MADRYFTPCLLSCLSLLCFSENLAGHQAPGSHFASLRSWQMSLPGFSDPTVARMPEASLALRPGSSSWRPENFSSRFKFLNQNIDVLWLLAFLTSFSNYMLWCVFAWNFILLSFQGNLFASRLSSFSIPFVRVPISKPSKDHLCSLLCLSSSL